VGERSYTAVEISAGDYLLRAKGSTLKFKGFLAVYEETRDEKVEAKPKPDSEEPGAEEAEPDAAGTQLPPLKEGDALALQRLDTDQHFTQPPPRFSEASLVKVLEENGIGRPSTYASIISTIEAREYTEKRDGKLYPTEVGFVVTDMLIEYFQDIMNVEYTAAMEEELDQIEEGTDNLDAVAGIGFYCFAGYCLVSNLAFQVLPPPDSLTAEDNQG
jgi:DNA topoisomerase-1